MRIQILFFAQVRELAGCAAAPLDLPERSTVADALQALARAYPALEPMWPHVAVAMDGELVREPQLVRDGAELALLPPVSGG